MKRSFRLTRSTDFQRVRREGQSYAHPLIVLVCAPNQEENTRFGVVAGRALGNAVQRNRSKRVIRAVLQSLLPHIKPGWDVVLISRRKLADAKYQQVQEALSALLDRAQLLSDTYDKR